MPSPQHRVIVIGAGVGGLACAIDLARQDLDVLVLERAAAPGGKMRQIEVDGASIDVGPTVLTMRHVFDTLFEDAGERLDDHVTLRRADILARHAWPDGSALDLFADRERSADAIARLAGPAEGRAFLAFCARAQRIHDALDRTFMQAQRPSPVDLVRRAGWRGLGGLMGISPFATLWSALAEHFRDARLLQLFGRYATYCGSSPFAAPATLMLVAHVEQEGVWLPEGGMHKLAAALAGLARAHGAQLRFGTEVAGVTVERGRVAGVTLATGEALRADLVVANADCQALARGRFGAEAARAVPRLRDADRSLSALTFAVLATPRGLPLVRHNVMFSGDYAAEFTDIAAGRLPREPTVYVCAQDRGGEDAAVRRGPERFFCIVHAPACGDTAPYPPEEIEACTRRSFEQLERCGLVLDRRPAAMATASPQDYDALFPATGGALYGRASHGWMASFARPGSRSRLPGLYLAGGSVHPGPGVPMAALSGRLAAESVMRDLASTRRFSRAAISGGMSTRSARTAGTP